MIWSDPNFRRSSVYEYGDLREVKVTVHLSSDGSIIWHGCAYDLNGVEMRDGVAGVSGPFEALAYVLEKHRK